MTHRSRQWILACAGLIVADIATAGPALIWRTSLRPGYVTYEEGGTRSFSGIGMGLRGGAEWTLIKERVALELNGSVQPFFVRISGNTSRSLLLYGGDAALVYGGPLGRSLRWSFGAGGSYLALSGPANTFELDSILAPFVTAGIGPGAKGGIPFFLRFRFAPLSEGGSFELRRDRELAATVGVGWRRAGGSLRRYFTFEASQATGTYPRVQNRRFRLGVATVGITWEF